MATVTASLESGLVQLVINTGTNQVTVTNNDPSRSALFNAFNASVLNGQPVGSVVVWSYTQPPSSSATIAIPTKDNNGNTINWVVGTVTTKGGAQVQTVTSPPWQLTMV
jgi:hypothetical protein